MGPLEFLIIALGLSLIVIVHESGHYLAARAFGMRVERYAVGIGPTIFKVKPKGSDTTFLVGAIPFLAYVQIAGMNPHEEVPGGDPRFYPNQPLYARVAAVAAGPFANYLLAMLVAFIIGLVGWPMDIFEQMAPDDPRARTYTVVAGDFADDSAGAAAGMERCDEFVRVEDAEIHRYRHLIAATKARPSQETTYSIRRYAGRAALAQELEAAERARLEGEGVEGDDLERGVAAFRSCNAAREAQREEGAPPVQELSIEASPNDRGQIGVVLEGWASDDLHDGPVSLGVGEAAKAAVLVPAELTWMQLSGITEMIKRRTTEGLGGPVMMGKALAAAAERGPATYFVMIIMLSVSLGFFNLLPFPGLDGGRLFFLAYEAITRRKPNEKFEGVVNTVGLVFLLGVLVLVTFRDIFGS